MAPTSVSEDVAADSWFAAAEGQMTENQSTAPGVGFVVFGERCG